MGYCLELDPKHVEERTFGKIEDSKASPRNNFRTLGFTVGYNRTDATYGWNGYMNGLTGIFFHDFLINIFYCNNYYKKKQFHVRSMKKKTVFYLNPTERYQQEEHSYPLVPGLTPIIYVQNEEQTFLDKPYTECIKVSFNITS